MFHQIEQILNQLDLKSISQARQIELQKLVQYVQLKKDNQETINLNFICTHNSRRSQFSQLWAKVAAQFYQYDINSFSGGVEITAFNQRAVDALVRSGFMVEKNGSENPDYTVYWSDNKKPLVMFSKLFDAPNNPLENFAAIMTCGHADENCPFVSGCDSRIPIRYEDPKSFDNTPQEKEAYDNKSLEIATEMMFVFSKIK